MEFSFTIGSGNVELDSFPVMCNALHRGEEVKLISNGVVRAGCYVRRQSGADNRPTRYVMYGKTGTHTIDYESTDADRLFAHLSGFVKNQGD